MITNKYRLFFISLVDDREIIKDWSAGRLYEKSITIKFLFILAVFVLIGCSAQPLMAQQKPNDQQKPIQGLTYYAGKDVLALDLTVNVTQGHKVTGSFSNRSLEIAPTLSIQSTASLKFITLPDYSAAYTMDVNAGHMKDVEMTVEIDEYGLLKSVNSTVTGKGADILKGATKFGAVLAGTFIGAMLKTAEQEKPSKCTAVDAEKLENDLQFFLLNSEKDCSVWNEIRELDSNIKAEKKALYMIEATIKNMDSDQIATTVKKIEAIKQVVKDRMEERSRLQIYLNDQFQKFKTENLQTKTDIIKRTVYFEIDEIPLAGSIEINKSKTEILSSLKAAGKNKAAELLKSSNLLIALTDLRNGPQSGKSPAKMPDDGIIYQFRQASPCMLSKYHVVSDKEVKISNTNTDPFAQSPVRHIEDQILAILRPDSLIHFVYVESSSWSKRNLSLDFSETGRVKKMVKFKGSSAGGFATALGESAQAGLSEYSESIGKIATIRETERKLKLDKLTTKLEELNKQKGIIDAQLSIEGTEASYDLLLEKQRIETELGVLQTRVNIGNLQATKTTEQLEIENLKQQVELLTQRLQILKLSREIQQAENATE